MGGQESLNKEMPIDLKSQYLRKMISPDGDEKAVQVQLPVSGWRKEGCVGTVICLDGGGKAVQV